MELQEFKNIWAEYDRKLDKSLQINMQLLRQMKMDKINKQTRGLFILKLAETLFALFILGYLVSFIAKNIYHLPLIISAGLLLLFTVMGFVSDIRQLTLILQLKVGYDDAIAPVQKKIGTLKAVIISYIKYGLLFIPFYPALMIVAGKIFMHIDFTLPQHADYLWSNVGVGALLLVPILWIFTELSKKDINPWARNLLSGSGYHQANAAAAFLHEIEEFEKES